VEIIDLVKGVGLGCGVSRGVAPRSLLFPDKANEEITQHPFPEIY
jgi:hypothetical protein